tara:strand:- start:330 stop:1019 length:690 start_codon:yes stop_codon:yes gene_type:complete
MSNRARIEKIISDSLDKQASQKKEFYLFGSLVYLQKPFSVEIDIQSVLDYLEKHISSHLFGEIDTIMVGSFSFLQERELEATYKDGAIYISNNIGSERDLLENIIHELSHSLEGPLGHFIYADHRIISEFIEKRKTLKRILESHGYNAEHLDFQEIEYNKEFDEFLYKDLGYATLQNLAMGLFHTPYAITSLREYWASGFEDYFLGDRASVKELSPRLFNKIEGVISYE